MEIDFLCIENENSQYELCLASQYAHMCTIWGHLNKLFYDSSHDLAYLAWKPWNFVHDRSFLRRVSTIFTIVQVYYFFSQLVNIKWHNAKALHFFEFFWTSYAWFKMRSKRRAWTFLARGWILQNYLWINDKTSTCEPENNFLKKSWENYDTVLVQIYLHSYWIGRVCLFCESLIQSFIHTKKWRYIHKMCPTIVEN
jgi:hypothetical protein